MEWLDFFLQQLVTALAWCLAVAVLAVLVFGGCAVANLVMEAQAREDQRRRSEAVLKDLEQTDAALMDLDL